MIQMVIECLMLYMFIKFSEPFNPEFKKEFLLIFASKRSMLDDIDRED